METTTTTDSELEARIERMLDIAGTTREQILDFEGLQRLDGIPGTTVYLTGSLAEEGLGNPGSDVDVVVIAHEEASYDLLRNYTATGHFSGRRRIEYSYWKPDKIEEVARRLAPPKSRPYYFNILDEEEVTFIHRIKIGLPILNADDFFEIRSRIDLERFRDYMVFDSICLVNTTLEDVWGMIDARDYDTALFRVRDLLREMFKAYCAHLGETNSNTKWLLKVLHKLGDEPRTARMLDAFWQLGFPDAPSLRADPAVADAYLRECIAVVNETVEWIQR